MKNRKKTIILLIIGVIFILVSLLIYARYIEPRQLTCQYVTLTVPKLHNELDGIKIAVISDLHLRPAVMKHELFTKMFARLNAERADIIFIAGDVMNRFDWVGNLEFTEICDFLRRLHAPYGVYAVAGNHDMPFLDKGLRQAFRDANIVLLEDELIKVKVRDNSLQLAGGLESYKIYEFLGRFFKDADRSLPIILLHHNPEIFQLKDNIADITISGHTHGGQVRIPYLLNSNIALLKMPYPYIRGLYHIDDRVLALTSGVGTSLIEVRLGRTPEIMVVTLKSEEKL